MNRRTLLASTATLSSIGFAGCLDQLAATDSDSPSLPAAVSELEFEITDTDLDPRDDPVISVLEETGEATVEGAIWVGSKKCKEATLADVSADESDGSVELRISHGKSDDHPDNRLLGGSFDEAMSADGYEATIAIDDVVQTVTVLERDAEGNSRRASPGN
ncbi:hypothetical protein JMJ58_08870 [Haloterrigena salifodinae]|uniref:Lipoprotein n=1 Tax=Haloterrigena salifodinae TaxID=2675099 RepID=A0A8T8E5A8_9EURY|nr:hypothetical protein [Haloterrigena salifodinae]QRV16958.1 hypothetical protein JMJ58_08870 [Haloterrigena salifodinae]